MFLTFIQGILLGLSIAAPVGPIGILCIRRTLAMGQRVGLVSGLGAATADGIYGCVAGFGLTAVADFLTQQAVWLRFGGGLFLCYLGMTTVLAKPIATDVSTVSDLSSVKPTELQAAAANPTTLKEITPRSRSLLTAYLSTLALTLTNPATIFSFVAIFAGLGIVESGQNYAKSSVLVLGVFLGSALWWLFLSGAVNLFRTQLTPAKMRWLNRAAGLVLVAFGVVALAIPR